MIPGIPKVKIDNDTIEVFRANRAKGVPITAICNLLKISRQCYDNWIAKAEIIENQLVEGELKIKELTELQLLYLTLLNTIRETKGSFIASKVEIVDDMSKDNKEMGHNRLKATLALLASEAPEHFGNKPQPQQVVTNQFNTLILRNELTDTARMTELVVDMVNDVLPDGTAEEKARLFKRMQAKYLQADNKGIDAEFEVVEPAKLT